MKRIWVELVLIAGLCLGLLWVGYKLGEARTEKRVAANLESLYVYTDETRPYADFRRYVALGTIVVAKEWALYGGPEGVR